MSNDPRVGLRDGTPEEAGLSARQLDHARELVAEWVKEGIHPAVVILVARHGVIALHEAFGRIGPEPDDLPLARDALFPLASTAKPITATALLILVEEGRVGLTRRVCDYLPEFTGDRREEVYVHQLLTHTSGLQSPPDIEQWMAEIVACLERPPRDPTLHRVTDAWLQMALSRPIAVDPGTEMFYETANYDLLGEIVRRVSGQSLRDFIHERIFRPLGMTDSQVGVPRELRTNVIRAVGEPPNHINWNAPPTMGATGGGAGTCSTARDMAMFGQAFLDGGVGVNGRVLSPTTVLQMTTNQIPGTPGVLIDERHDEASWGFGWGVASHEKWNYFPTHTTGTFHHPGASGAHLWCDPASRLVGACFAASVKDIGPDIWAWQGDLFVNAVTAAVLD